MSFSIGLSGLRAVSEELNVISHNIANVNTAGFKAGRAEFAALYSGGQAGGVEMNNVSQNFDRNGDVVTSGRALDLAISGSGFFVLSDSKGQVAYSRAGMFQKDAANRIVASNGMALQGYGVNADGQLVPGVIGRAPGGLSYYQAVDLIKGAAKTIGEPITVVRFVRIQLGAE